MFNNTIVSIIALLLAAVAISMSAYRRANDAKKKYTPFIVGGSAYFLFGMLPLFVLSYLAYIPFIASIGFLLSLLTYPSSPVKSYIMGYSGPVDLASLKNESAATSKSRIEPTLAGAPNANVTMNISHSEEQQYIVKQHDNTLADNDLGVKIREILVRYKLQMAAGIAIVIVAMVSVSFINNSETSDSTPLIVEEEPVIESSIDRQHMLNMPDDFTLYASQYNGLIINWQADEQQDGVYWQQLTLEGDNSCKEITFNNGDTVRPIEVFIENTTDYFAHFSPLDTQNLLKQIAFRGKFTLCGYEFSLKGSQSALGRHPYYADKVDY